MMEKKEADLTPQSLNLGSKKVAYYDLGQGLPVVLVHGWLFNKEIFRILIRDLSDNGFRAIALDLPGFGDSEELSVPHSPENYADFLEKFLLALDLPSFFLLGSSAGGAIALGYTLKHREKVRKLILHAPAFYGKLIKVNPILLLVSELAERFKIVRYLAFNYIVSTCKKSQTKTLDKVPSKFRPELQKIADKSLYFLDHTVSKEAAEEIIRYILSLDLRPKLKNLAVETLIIRGGSDQEIKLKDMIVLKRLLPKSRLINILGGTHFLPGEKPEEFDQAVLAFLKEKETFPQSFKRFLNTLFNRLFLHKRLATK